MSICLRHTLERAGFSLHYISITRIIPQLKDYLSHSTSIKKYSSAQWDEVIGNAENASTHQIVPRKVPGEGLHIVVS